MTPETQTVYDALARTDGDMSKLTKAELWEALKQISLLWAFAPWWHVWININLRWWLRKLTHESKQRTKAQSRS